MQGGRQNEKTKNHVPNERTEQNSRKKKTLNKMEITYLPNEEFKTLVITMVNELRKKVDKQ